MVRPSSLPWGGSSSGRGASGWGSNHTSNNNLRFKWVVRAIVAVVLLDLVLQLRFFPRLLGLGAGGALHRRGASPCTPYDPVAAPGLFHLLGTTFNSTPPTADGSPEALFKGKGVVMAASGTIMRQAAGAFVTAYVIRHVLKEDLPIEIFYAGPEEAFHGPVRTALESLPNVRLVDLEGALEDLHAKGLRSLEPLPPPGVLKSYAAKVYAVQACSFHEALLFDAGAMPFVPTARFFTLPSYQKHGVALFGDYVAIERARWGPVLRDMCLDVGHVSKVLGGRELDSSCVVLDKQRNADALAVTVALNGPLQAATYAALLGDKDTWALGMFHVGKAISVHELEAGYLLVSRGEKGQARKVLGHVQFLKDRSAHDPPGLVPLHHNNQLFDLREYPTIADATYLDIFSHLGDVLLPTSRRRDCRPYPVEELWQLPPAMHTTYLAVAQALKDHGIDHCVCRDDWISCEADIERLRRKWWWLHWMDTWAPRRKREEWDKTAAATVHI